MDTDDTGVARMRDGDVQTAGPEYRLGLQLALAFMRGQRAAASLRDEELDERRREGENDGRALRNAKARADGLEQALRQLVDAVKHSAPEVLQERLAIAAQALEQDIPF